MKVKKIIYTLFILLVSFICITQLNFVNAVNMNFYATSPSEGSTSVKIKVPVRLWSLAKSVPTETEIKSKDGPSASLSSSYFTLSSGKKYGNYYGSYGVIFSKGKIGNYVDGGITNVSFNTTNDIFDDYFYVDKKSDYPSTQNSTIDSNQTAVYQFNESPTNDVGTIEVEIGTNSELVFSEQTDVDNVRHIRYLTISENYLKYLKQQGYFDIGLQTTNNGVTYVGTYVSLIPRFYIADNYETPTTPYDAVKCAIDNMMNADTRYGLQRTGTDNPTPTYIFPGTCILNLYDNIIWVEKTKVEDKTVNIEFHFMENGVELSNTSVSGETISVTENTFSVPTELPIQSTTSFASESSTDYNAFTAKKYKVNSNGAEVTISGTPTIASSDLAKGDTIHVYFERTKVQVQNIYEKNGSKVGESAATSYVVTGDTYTVPKNGSTTPYENYSFEYYLAGTSTTKRTEATISKADIISNGYKINVYYTLTEANIVYHFRENGKDLATTTDTEIVANSTYTVPTTLPTTSPQKPSSLNSDSDYDKFTYTYYDVNGTVGTGTTIPKADLYKSDVTINVYFERTKLNIKYTLNDTAVIEKTIVKPGKTTTISRNEYDDDDERLKPEYHNSTTVSLSNSSNYSITEGTDDVTVTISNNSNNGNAIVINFIYNFSEITLNYHFVRSDDTIETETQSAGVATVDSALTISLPKTLVRTYSASGASVTFGFFGGTITGGKINDTSTSLTYADYPSDEKIIVKPDSTGIGSIVIDIYYGFRAVDVSLVDTSNASISRKIATYAYKYGETLSVDIFSSVTDTSAYFIFGGNKYVYNGMRNVTKSNLGEATDSISSLTFDTSKITTQVSSMPTNSVLMYGGDYTKVQFKLIRILPSKVYVRHLVEVSESEATFTRTINGERKYYKIIDSLANSDQIVKHNYSYYNIDSVSTGLGFSVSELYTKTNYEVTSNLGKTGYSEYYEIDPKDTLTVEKSRTIYNGSIYYEYYGHSVYYDSSSATSAVVTSYDGTVTGTECIVDGDKQATYIDFFYTPKSELPPPTPTTPPFDPDNPTDPEPDTESPIEPDLGADPENDSGEKITEANGNDPSSSCRVEYVPITENIRPYLNTKMSSPYTLIYQVTDVDETSGTKTYSIKQYDAFTLDGGYVTNTDDTTKAKFVGNTNDTVITNGTSDTFTLTLNGISGASTTTSSFSTLDPRNQTAIRDVVKAIPSTSKSNFTSSSNVAEVAETKFNGLRTPKGVAVYDVVGLVGVNSGTTIINNFEIEADEDNTTKINVYTPLKVGKSEITSNDTIVNHLDSASTDTVVLQKNATFTVKPSIDSSYTGNIYKASAINSGNYLKHYYIVFDFKVTDIVVKNSSGTVVENISEAQPNTAIQVPIGGTLTAKEASLSSLTTEEIAASSSSSESRIRAIAVTKNATDALNTNVILNNQNIFSGTSSLNNLIASGSIQVRSARCEGTNDIIHGNITINGATVNVLYPADDTNNQNYPKMEADSLYYAQDTQKAVTVDRIYDFKVTDCLDVNFKNAFRKTSDTSVNESTGLYYFSGIKRLIFDGLASSQIENVLVDRSTSVLNKVQTKAILPLGPVKHSDSTYTQAPKLGYRISFDLKTTGVYNPNNSSSGKDRSIVIKPSYYFISKDGTVFNSDITLYYKNSSGKYVSFDGSNYTIYFKPNDGYRVISNIETPNVDTMSDKLEKLVIGSEDGFVLNDNMISHNNAYTIQTWHGEFKLPNSTIAVPSGGSINNPLTNGYIGVKFDIVCQDKYNSGSVVSLSYNQNDKNASGDNTTQWDYEGYLGISAGKTVNSSNVLKIRLENGTWNINNQSVYEKVKGTVLLYDADNRAANDFE